VGNNPKASIDRGFTVLKTVRSFPACILACLENIHQLLKNHIAINTTRRRAIVPYRTVEPGAFALIFRSNPGNQALLREGWRIDLPPVVLPDIRRSILLRPAPVKPHSQAG
jgi:hypothetical protein